MKPLSSTWAFSRIGGVDQVVIRNGGDIANLAELDQKLWAVLAMPTSLPGYKDALEYCDADKDGKIRVPDILRLVEELKGQLTSLDLLFEQNDSIAANQVAEPNLKNSVAQMQGKHTSIDLASVDEAIGAFSALPFNGDGVVVPATTQNEAIKALIAALAGAGYAAKDASGEAGVDGAALDNFIVDAGAYKAWLNGAEAFTGLFGSEEEGRKAVDLFKTIRSPLDDYFKRCRILAMAGSSSAMVELENLMASVLSRNLPEDAEELKRLPIALPDADSVLHLDRALHPTYRKALSAFFAVAGKNLVKQDSVSQAEWETIAATTEAYAGWLDGKPATGAAGLGALVFEESFGSEAIAAIKALIEEDLAMAGKAESLKKLRILLVLKRDFLHILGNFVNLDEFYVRKKGMFMAGRLFLDGRELELCLDVRNAAAHTTMAGLSSIYLIYCDLSRKDEGKKSIVAALTAGDADNIFVGRNGIYYDADGADWDAVITKVVVQPISIREAFFSPYKLLIRTIEDLAMKRAAAAEAASMDKMKGAAQSTVSGPKPDAKPEQALPKKIDVGTVAAIGVALGSVGAMLTGILGIFFGMGAWMPVGVVAILLLISGPSMILAYMKLRKRNIGPLLNAEGWAVNGRLKINVPFGGTLSHLATLPLGTTRLTKDPFAEKKKPWALYIVLVIIVACVAAYFLGWLGPIFG
ncbi:MAG: hypothetical protein Q8O15_10065 [Rectinemataceae bacterium]|nr:hypothetical protein [Rectinemataceae bacterium]